MNFASSNFLIDLRLNRDSARSSVRETLLASRPTAWSRLYRDAEENRRSSRGVTRGVVVEFYPDEPPLSGAGSLEPTLISLVEEWEEEEEKASHPRARVDIRAATGQRRPLDPHKVVNETTRYL